MIFQLFRVYVEYHCQFPPVFNKNGIIGLLLKFRIDHIFKSNVSFALAKTALPFAKGKTGGSRFLKICFHKGVATFFKPF